MVRFRSDNQNDLNKHLKGVNNGVDFSTSGGSGRSDRNNLLFV